MRWLSFAILAAVAVVLQTSAVPRVAIQSVTPDLLFILAVHYALWGPWPEGAIAGWLLGLAADLQSADRIGLHALWFGMASFAIIRVRQVVFRDHAMTQIVITFAFTMLVQIGVGLYRRWGAQGAEQAIVWPALLTGMYTAICAPYLHWLLIRMGRWTGLRQSRGLLSPQ